MLILTATRYTFYVRPFASLKLQIVIASLPMRFPKIVKDSFGAWVARQPDSTTKLMVIGEVEVPGAGWSVSLRKSSQSIDPTVLLLDVTALGPPQHGESPSNQRIALQFGETHSEERYSEVSILHESGDITVDVHTLN